MWDHRGCIVVISLRKTGLTALKLSFPNLAKWHKQTTKPQHANWNFCKDPEKAPPSKQTAQQTYVTRKHLGPPTDKQAFVFPQVYVSKPRQNSEQGTKSLFPHHPITPDVTTREKTSLKSKLLTFPPNHDPTVLAQVPCSQLHRKVVANPAFSDQGLFCKITRPLSLLMSKRVCFFLDIKNILVNHKTILPSSFAQIGFFLM